MAGETITVTVTGKVVERTSKNDKIPTGDIEVIASDITVLNGVVSIIADLISSHMGKWGADSKFIGDKKPLPIPESDCAKILQAADYIASRREILDFDFE